ncbi:MAG: hypothetical protein ACLGXA_04545 [Acidobacteriota bacterium]
MFMTYETATQRKSEKCTIRLFRGTGEKLGAGNDPNAPIYGGYVLKAVLTTSRGKNALAKVSLPLPDGGNIDPDRWRDINRNPALIRRAVNHLSEKAREMGYREVEVRDEQDTEKPKVLSVRKLAPRKPS